MGSSYPSIRDRKSETVYDEDDLVDLLTGGGTGLRTNWPNVGLPGAPPTRNLRNSLRRLSLVLLIHSGVEGVRISSSSSLSSQL